MGRTVCLLLKVELVMQYSYVDQVMIVTNIVEKNKYPIHTLALVHMVLIIL